MMQIAPTPLTCHDALQALQYVLVPLLQEGQGA